MTEIEIASVAKVKLKLLPPRHYRGIAAEDDPISFYSWPIIGKLYRRRVELCLSECTTGKRVLEVGFGSGATFLNLADLYEEIYGLDLNAPANAVADSFRPFGLDLDLRNGTVLDLPYSDGTFDTVLLISILEHLQPGDLSKAFFEIHRVLKPGGQVVYGVPVERRLMVFFFRLLGYNIREHHFSTHEDCRRAALDQFEPVRIQHMLGTPGFLGPVYEIGNFRKMQKSGG